MRQRNRATLFLIIAAVLTGAYLLGITFNVSPWLRGPEEWRWPYVIPVGVIRNWLPLVICAAYLFFIYWWDKRALTRRRTVLALLLGAVMTPVLQLALLYLDHDDVRSQLFLRTVSDLSGGFYNVGALVTNNADFLGNFAARMSGYPIHPQRHPPGLPLLFALTRQFFDQFPSLASSISSGLRPYQCHNLELMVLPNSAIAAAAIQMFVPVALGFGAWAVYFLGREVYDRKTAVRAALLWPLLPSVALWATRWNHIYALFTLLAFLFFHLALVRRRAWLMIVSGLIVSLASFFSFGNVVIIGFLGLYALIWFVAQRERPSFTWLLGAAALFFLGLSLVWLFVLLVYDLSLLNVWNTAMGTHLGIGRSYTTWLFYHLYDFFVFLGIPLFVFWLAQTVRAVRQWSQGSRDVLAISFAIALILFNLSGLSQGEVARVWAFLLPLALLIGVRYAPKQGLIFTGLAALLAVQVLVSNTFLQPVSTGLLDPPAPPQTAVLTSTMPIAIWQDGLILQDVSVRGASTSSAGGAEAEPVEAGQPVIIEAVWDSNKQSDKPYTLFIHLLDEQGQLIAQYDGMPLNGQWPTTCWQSGRPFSDVYELQLPDDVQAGIIKVTMGFYFWPTGERLPLVQPDGRVDHNIDIGAIRLDK